jgi:NitT/TauT family transport system substrate-binding protein
VHLYDTGQQAMLDMLAGAAEFATVGDTPLARAAVEGKSVNVIAAISENSYANFIIARRDRGIRELEDLRDKRLGRVPWTTADFFSHVYLITSQISPNELQVVDLIAADIPATLVRGEVDAVATWPPYSTRAVAELGTNAVIFHDPSVYTMEWTVVVRPDWGNLQGRAVRKFLRGLVRANRFLREQPEESRAIYGKRVGLDPAAVERAMKGWAFKVAIDQSLILSLEDQARWILRKQGENQSPPNFLRFINVDGLKAVSPGAVNVPGT